MSRVAYYRVSTGDQSIEAQRSAMGGGFDREFSDEGVSGGSLAASRKGFAALLSYVREGDTVCVYAIDRLGRDAIDVQQTVKALIDAGVTVDVRGLGPIAKGVGELIVAVLAQVAAMERARIAERTADGRARARTSLAETGRTHRGKAGVGRPTAAAQRDTSPDAVAAWRREAGASIAGTAKHFGLSVSTVKRYCAA